MILQLGLCVLGFASSCQPCVPLSVTSFMVFLGSTSDLSLVFSQQEQFIQHLHTRLHLLSAPTSASHCLTFVSDVTPGCFVSPACDDPERCTSTNISLVRFTSLCVCLQSFQF
eukprot:m.254498 g.254498  ORF g.254498 m.254498 type:complete len:113 (-) comp15941_c0_seq4:195-533(-)